MPFFSRVTQRTEYLPCAISLAGRPGSDLELLQVVEQFLLNERRPTNVETGRSMGRAFRNVKLSQARL